MAAACGGGPGSGSVRLRLLFDYPPPGSPSCGRCWLLLEPGQARLVTDLSSLIRDRFGFSRRAQLSLFLDGALLPPTESARLVRDNDALRVKLEKIIGGDGYDETTNGFRNSSKKERKRQRKMLEAEDSISEGEEHRKRKTSKRNLEYFSSPEENIANHQDPKKRKKNRKKVTERNCVADSKSEDSICHSKKLKNQVIQEKKQKTGNKEKKQKARTFEAKNSSQKTLPTVKNTVVKSSTKEGGTSSESFTSPDSDDSVPHTKQMPSHETKVKTQHTQKSLADSPLKPVSAHKLATKPKAGKSPKLANSKAAEGQSSGSDSDSSSGDEEEQLSSNLKCKIPSNKQETVTGLTAKTKPETSSSESDMSESETCTAKSTKTKIVSDQPLRGNGGKQLPATTGGLATSPGDAGRGRGRGELTFWRGPRVRGCRGMGRGRGRGESPFFFHYSDENQKQKQLREAATNASVIIQNPPEVPKKDYSKLPLLAAPPQIGEKIAFKLLELTENYTPEVSDYKEGKIISWNPTNKQLELEILSFSAVAKEPGKFDLVYQSADGAETVEYAVSQDKKITESWDALIEPRLIVDLPNSVSSTENGNP
ncbi:coilin [Eublepharis macularius]|uniref:Coilin n=1 Tax=Eublepharis macularius TaxID=481883 RepID=A0AA97LLC2_EUBMA|nr:coilin [Eublepharis macularius]